MTRIPSPYELLVFDWDGTLLDSIGAIVACTRDTLAQLGIDGTSEERIRDGIGMDLRETVEHIVPGVDDALFLEICRVYRRLWVERFAEGPVLFEGVAATLEALCGTGHRLAIATAKPRDGLDLDLARTGVGELFSAIGTVDDAPGKPHPKMLLDILTDLQVPGDRALLIGDSVHDVGMARNAGVVAVGVASGTQGADALLAAGAADCLGRVTELPEWLGHAAAGRMSTRAPSAAG